MAIDFSKYQTTPTAPSPSGAPAIDFSKYQAQSAPPTAPKPTFMQRMLGGAGKRGVAGEILPTGGAILGGILGAAAGGAGAAMAGPEAVPVGAYAGGVAGSGAGGAAGEAAQQGIEKLTGQRTSVSGKEIAKTGATFGALEAIGGPVASAAGKVLKVAGKTAYDAIIPKGIREAELLQAYKANVPLVERVGRILGKKPVGKATPVTTASTAHRMGLMGTEPMLGVQARKAGEKLWNGLIAPRLDASGVKSHMPDLFKEAEQMITGSTPELSRRKDLLRALEVMKEDYAGVEDVPLTQLQQFKEGWEKFVPEKAYRGLPIAGAFNDMKNMISGIARQKIYSALGPEVRQAYLDYGNLKGIQELGAKAMTGGKLKGGFGGFWSAVKDIALTPIMTVGGQTVYRSGQGVELIGKPGMRFVRDLVGGVPDIGKDTTSAAKQ